MVIKAPEKIIYRDINKPTLYLAGSTGGDNWRSYVEQELSEFYNILNPKSDRSYVHWEHNGLSISDLVLFYFDPDQSQNVSLLQLGLFVSRDNLFVCCPEGVEEKEHIDFVCSEFNIMAFKKLDELINHLKPKNNES